MIRTILTLLLILGTYSYSQEMSEQPENLNDMLPPSLAMEEPTLCEPSFMKINPYKVDSTYGTDLMDGCRDAEGLVLKNLVTCEQIINAGNPAIYFLDFIKESGFSTGTNYYNEGISRYAKLYKKLCIMEENGTAALPYGTISMGGSIPTGMNIGMGSGISNSSFKQAYNAGFREGKKYALADVNNDPENAFRLGAKNTYATRIQKIINFLKTVEDYPYAMLVEDNSKPFRQGFEAGYKEEISIQKEKLTRNPIGGNIYR